MGEVTWWLQGENHADLGKHRTEVTEATEGGLERVTG